MAIYSKGDVNKNQEKSYAKSRQNSTKTRVLTPFLGKF